MNRVGIDLVEVDEVVRSLAEFGDRFLEKFFTDSEIADCAGDPRRLAARLAVKEAVIKALRPARDDPVPARQIEVVSSGSGPELRLHGCVAALARSQGWTDQVISLTHTDSTAGAVVIACVD